MSRNAAAGLAAFLITAGSSSALAQSLDGTYNATIKCTGFPTTQVGPFSQAMTLRIAGTSITGERAVGTATQVGASGVTERWTGTVAPNGELLVQSQSASQQIRIDGSFTGRVGANGLAMQGAQSMSTQRTGKVSRDCSVSGKR